MTLVFEKNANFVAENCQKSHKIVIITSTPDWGQISPFGRIKMSFGAFSAEEYRPNHSDVIVFIKIVPRFT
jgi:hypothetical protein